MLSEEEKNLRQRLSRVEALLQEVDQGKDSAAAAARTREIVQGLMEFHGAAIGKMLERLAGDGERGLQTIHALAEDDLIANMLLLYGLHPLDLEARVRGALEKVRPYLHSHGGNVELLSLEDGVVRLRLQGSCHGCPSSAQTLRSTIDEAILEKAPDVTAIEVEGETAGIETAAEGVRFALPILAG